MFEKMTLQQYNEVLASKEPTPGGGSALAVVGTIACSLVEMAINITLPKTETDEFTVTLLNDGARFVGRAKKRLQQLANDDATAFDRIIKFLRLPKDTDEDKKRRANSLQSAYHMAALVPLDVMTVCKETLCKAEKVLPYLNKYVASDCVIGIDLLKRVIVNSQENVYANTSLIKDETLKNSLEKQAQSVLQSVQ